MEHVHLLKLDAADFGSTGAILLENQFGHGWPGGSAFLTGPVQVLVCDEPAGVLSTLNLVDEALKEGFHAAGFISYEAGSALVPHQKHRDCDGFPLVWIGLYESATFTRSPVVLPSPPPPEELEPVLEVTAREFCRDVERILDHIRAGETYQVNYTCRTAFSSLLEPWERYVLLKRAQPVPYAAFLNCGEFSVISQSPELFLQRENLTLQAKPMKGTAPRGADPGEDREWLDWLRNSEKNRAENLMIVDLMRNDIGRIAHVGTVEVFDPFHIDCYRTVHQMTTGVRGLVPRETPLSEIIQHTFPPGSITGAPKVRTMQIIRELERSPRKVYTGAIGRFHPGGDFAMNVPIRTIIMNRDGRCEMGIGSGIVADSDPAEEYEETVLKASFLTVQTPGGGQGETDLLETMLLDARGTIHHLPDHMDRISRSAAELGYPCDADALEKSLVGWLGEGSRGPAVIRMRLDRRGGCWFELLPFPGSDSARGLRVLLCAKAVDGNQPLLLHKTTDRHLYDGELAAARDRGFDEVLFTNEQGELTEGAITNLFLRLDGGWITPSLACGLLPGTWRARFLARTGAVETRITPEALSSAREIAVGNAVRGKMSVREVVDHGGNILYRARS